MTNLLVDLRALGARRIVGLMSGTSVDGIDAALIEVSGHGGSLTLNRVCVAMTVPYERVVRERIHALFSGHVADVCEMNFVLGELFADAALQVIRKGGFSPSDVHLVGSHGQTVYHIPRGTSRTPSTLQIGEPAVIAERTGITTVADFRPRDIAAGGEGAPLVPYVDWQLCHRCDQTIALHNIGGIANVTVVTPDMEGVYAFDTGPGNMVIDAAVALMTQGAQSYDEDGRVAMSGVPDIAMLERLLADPYLERTPPKSTGREYYGAQFVDGLIKQTGCKPDANLVRTLTEFVAQSIARAYARHIFPRSTIASVFLSGGGARNPALRNRIAQMLAPVAVADSDVLGLPLDAKEAIAFAILANETVCGEPSNVPGATGARGRRILGKIITA